MHKTLHGFFHIFRVVRVKKEVIPNLGYLICVAEFVHGDMMIRRLRSARPGLF
jgi:hypothetical protein